MTATVAISGASATTNRSDEPGTGRSDALLMAEARYRAEAGSGEVPAMR